MNRVILSDTVRCSLLVITTRRYLRPDVLAYTQAIQLIEKCTFQQATQVHLLSDANSEMLPTATFQLRTVQLYSTLLGAVPPTTLFYSNKC